MLINLLIPVNSRILIVHSTPPIKMSCTLYKVPSEMREAIILLALPDEWNGKTPEIIKALRIDRKLHAEAMQAFNKMGYAYVLRRENDWGFGDMKESAISMIRKVKIIIE
jgi:hypothetical protein